MTATYDATTVPTLHFERELRHPAEAVWAAISDPAEMTRWFPTAVAGEPALGASLRFTFTEHDLPEMVGEVTEFEPPHRLAFTWGEDHLHFVLEPAAPGRTLLRLTVELGTPDKAARDGAGWSVCLDRLSHALGGDGAAPDLGFSGEWREYYDEYASRGFPADAPLPE
jgi:uncharacterized protein YndB with AHSA1/START domain